MSILYCEIKMKTMVVAIFWLIYALILSSLAKLSYVLDGNAAIIIISSVAAFACTLYVLNCEKNSVPVAYWLLGAAAIEMLLYQIALWIQLVVTASVAAGLLASNACSAKDLVPWLGLRFLMVALTSALSYELQWRAAQLCLTLALLCPPSQQKFVATIAAVAALLLYSGDNVIPHDIPLVLLVFPLLCTLGLVVDDTASANKWSKGFVGMLILVCFLFPHHKLLERTTSACSDVSNAELCQNGQVQLQLSGQCCCRKGFVQMNNEQRCVSQECTANLLANPAQDCCKMPLVAGTSHLLHGPYQCLCNNQPGQPQLHVYDVDTKSCKCKPPAYGTRCEFNNSAVQ